jgi:hypothetical protein
MNLRSSLSLSAAIKEIWFQNFICTNNIFHMEMNNDWFQLILFNPTLGSWGSGLAGVSSDIWTKQCHWSYATEQRKRWSYTGFEPRICCYPGRCPKPIRLEVTSNLRLAWASVITDANSWRQPTWNEVSGRIITDEGSFIYRSTFLISPDLQHANLECVICVRCQSEFKGSAQIKKTRFWHFTSQIETSVRSQFHYWPIKTNW